MDASLVENELVHSIMKCMAFSNVNWTYLFSILKDMGFGKKMGNWVKFCIYSVSFSVMLNGYVLGFFQSQKGLRQGDPFSPFLFLLVMNGLSHMFRIENENGWSRGFGAHLSIANGMIISHLLYTDDSHILCEAEA